MAAALPGEAPVGLGFAGLIGQAYEFAVLDPGFVAAVEFSDEAVGEICSDFGMIGRTGQVGLFLRIVLEVEELEVVADRISRGRKVIRHLDFVDLSFVRKEVSLWENLDSMDQPVAN